MPPKQETVVIMVGDTQDGRARYSWAELGLLPAELDFFDWLIREVEEVRPPSGARLEYALKADEPTEIQIPEDRPPGPGARLPGARRPVLLRIGIGGGINTLLTVRLSEVELRLVELAAEGIDSSTYKRGGPLLDYKLGPEFTGAWKPESTW